MLNFFYFTCLEQNVKNFLLKFFLSKKKNTSCAVKKKKPYIQSKPLTLNQFF